MTLLDYHNYFRKEKSLPFLKESLVLNQFASKNAKWMARRKFNNFWNFDKVRSELILLDFEEIDFNIAIGYTEDIVMKHLLNNAEKSFKIFSNFEYFGSGTFETKYKHWCMLYGK